MYHTTHGVEIPKSSLEVVKSDVETSLKKAQAANDQQGIDKYHKELVELNKKIRKFEQEWLEYRKNQLKVLSPTTPEVTIELNEINKLLEALSK